MIDIHNVDCMEYMKSMEDASIDLIVTDPPYLLTHTKIKSGEEFDGMEYMDELSTMAHGIENEQLDEFMRILKKPNMYLWGNWKLIVKYLDYFMDKDVNTNLLCWHKTSIVPMCNNIWVADTEYCLYVRGEGVRLHGGFNDHKTYWVSDNMDIRMNKMGHPTVKPLNIIKQMVKNSSVEGDVVFDPYLGSGTTAVACKLLNRNCIGCEIEPKYIEIIEKRLGQNRNLDRWM